MFKFKESKESIASDLLLWQSRPTQVSIRDTYELKIHPVTSIFNEGPINFEIPNQPKGMISDIEIVTTFKVKKGDANLDENHHCSIINGFADALWDLVDCTVSDRLSLMQSMRNSYAYQCFFNHCLNSDANREDYLFSTMLWKMDSGLTKADSETPVFRGNGIKNRGAAERAARIAGSQSVTVTNRLQCPLFTTAKALPTNMSIRVTLSRNSDKFLLIADEDDYRVIIQDVHLKVNCIRPHDIFNSLIEERLLKEPAPYIVTKPEIIIKPISQSGRIVRLNHIFPGKLPRHAFFCVQRSRDFEGSFDTNPMSFCGFSKFQLHIDGVPYFNEPLEIAHVTVGGQKVYKENATFLRQLYKTIGKDVRGCGMINSKNFQQHFMVGVSLTGDRSSASAPYLSPQSEASTQLEIDFGYDTNVSDNLILIVYAIYDRIIKISATRELEIID
jgi:hypothetical protein